MLACETNADRPQPQWGWVDRELERLACEAQQYPPGNWRRQRALAELVTLLRRSGDLCRPRYPINPKLYHEVYEEAQNRIFAHVCHKIDSYRVGSGVRKWVNFLLKKRFSEAVKFVLDNYCIVGSEVACTRMSIDSFDNLPVVDSAPLLSVKVIECIRSDPEGQFSRQHITHRDDVNFQWLALKINEGYSLSELSTQVNVPVSTLSGFYYRCLEKFAPIIKTYLD